MDGCFSFGEDSLAGPRFNDLSAIPDFRLVLIARQSFQKVVYSNIAGEN